MQLAEVSQFILYRQVSDPHKNFGVDLKVLWEYFSYSVSCDIVQNWNHLCRLFCQPNSYVGKSVADVHKVDLKRPFVVLAHICDARLVDVFSVFLVMAQEVSKLFADVVNYFGFRYPLSQVFLIFTVVIEVLQILLTIRIVLSVGGIAAHHLLSLAVGLVLFAVLAVGHESCCRSNHAALNVPVLHFNRSFSLTTGFSVNHFLLFIVDAFIFVAIKFWLVFVVSEKLLQLQINTYFSRFSSRSSPSTSSSDFESSPSITSSSTIASPGRSSQQPSFSFGAAPVLFTGVSLETQKDSITLFCRDSC